MLYVVTAVHNRYEITKRFVEQLKKQSIKDYKLILVDDGCTDGTSEMVKVLLPNSIILKGNGNLYWGGALHKAYLWLRDNAQASDSIMFANDDTHFSGDYLERGVQYLSKYPNSLVTGCGYSERTSKQLDGVVHWNYKKGGSEAELQPEDKGNCASTRSLFFTLETMKKIGGFHPILLPHYYSDYEWTIRAGRKGIQTVSFADLKYSFDEGTTGDNDLKKLSKKKLFSKRSNRNPFYRVIFIILSTPLIYLPEHLLYQGTRYIKKIGTFIEIMRQ